MRFDQQALELFDAAGDARFDGAKGHIQNFGDLRIGIIFEIKQRNRRLEIRIDFRQGAQNRRGVGTGQVGFDGGQFALGVLEFCFREANDAAAPGEVFAMQGREQPAFCFGFISQLSATLRKNVKRLLSQVPGFTFAPREAEREPVQGFIVKLDQLLKIHIRRHTASFYQIRAAKTRTSSRENCLVAREPSGGQRLLCLVGPVIGRCPSLNIYANGSGGSFPGLAMRSENQSAMEFAPVVYVGMGRAASKGAAFHSAALRALCQSRQSNFSTNWPLAEIEEMANPKPKFTTARPA
jgi:hypothetical protein